jgi:hypothetical protein
MARTSPGHDGSGGRTADDGGRTADDRGGTADDRGGTADDRGAHGGRSGGHGGQSGGTADDRGRMADDREGTADDRVWSKRLPARTALVNRLRVRHHGSLPQATCHLLLAGLAAGWQNRATAVATPVAMTKAGAPPHASQAGAAGMDKTGPGRRLRRDVPIASNGD